MKLNDYIDKYYGGVQAEFARVHDIKPQQVSQWIKSGYIVTDDHQLFSFRRQLVIPIQSKQEEWQSGSLDHDSDK
ncbi:hypothetical protein MZE56_001235 [Rahnella perminowiae]|nr:hypothetical protein [Rahnella perminowiae]MCR8998673.1 hypothetical protein [Rahnella perminowiae]MCR8998731.1 hypothetical protein [Rahnella perminowiae]